VLKGEGMDLHGLFFNPNIHPEEEYLKRKENVEIFSRAENIPVELWDDMRQEVWENYKGSDEDRCNMCYSIRMDKTASIAKEKGFDAFSTTLLVSPYQKHELIKEIGERLAKKYGIDFYYKDFRPGFRQGQQQAREMGLYRQKFCGCIVSFIESKNRGK
jgi:predicted adenine nucleotide alpha hydrolase (AANH) superfamily ATPase